MRSILCLGILALCGCESRWSWRLSDCSTTSSGCPTGDMSSNPLSDLAGDLAGTIPDPEPDMAGQPPSYVSLGSRIYYNGSLMLGSSDNKFALYVQQSNMAPSSYGVTNDFTTQISGVSYINVSPFPGSTSYALLALTNKGNLLTRLDNGMAAAFVQVASAGQPMNALWMSTPDFNNHSAGWAVGQAGTVLSISYTTGSPTITPTQEAAGVVPPLLGLDGIDSMMVMTTFDLGTGSGGRAWAVGTGGTIIENSTTGWRRIGMPDFAGMTPPTNTLYGVSHTTGDDTIIAVGAGGISIQRGLDMIWSSKPTGTNVTLYGVAANSATDAIAVGAGGTIMRLSATGWAAENVNAFPAGKPSGTLRAVRCGSSGDCWVVGDGSTLWHWDGGSCTRSRTDRSLVFPKSFQRPR